MPNGFDYFKLKGWVTAPMTKFEVLYITSPTAMSLLWNISCDFL
ncbi:hypothetical protein RT41_GL001384 [Lactococcus fujiensis JCM 16395]|uniref:Uncharacterized protein n=1 Tax=Lactococcus fujiensis JCM 16395 TaxID=1291764 RepID=A0A2A5RHU1_9LACT|nr:hypothetical protein RT41_GL001384 [Lactococcus fujiensis JCM 16395]